MRQLRLSKQPTDPNWAADHAQTQPILQRLAAANPLPLEAAAQQRLLRCLIAVARQYRGRGVAWADLLAAGYMAAARCYADCADPARRVGWWMREGIIAAIFLDTDNSE